MARPCAVIGIGQTDYRKRLDVTLDGLVRMAALEALADAELTFADIDAIVIGKAPDALEGVMMPELSLADALGDTYVGRFFGGEPRARFGELEGAMRMIAEAGRGVLILIRDHEPTMFSRIVNDNRPERQGQLLENLAALVAEGRVQPILTTRIEGLTAESMKTAHALIEKQRTIGKIVIVA